MANVVFANVIAKDGLTAQERFDAMTKNSNTFYKVENELYFGSVKLSTELASEIGITDAVGNFEATNVEGALAEICTKYPVTVAKTTGGENDDFVYRYTFSQGGTAIENGVIDIAKDMVATEGELVHPTHENPIIIDGQTIESGTYIKMTIANGTPFYIDVLDLIEYNTFNNTAEVLFTDNNHTITAEIGKVAATKSIYQAAAEAVYTQVQSGASFVEGTVYYTYDGNTYTEDNTVDALNFEEKVAAGLYVLTSEATTEINVKAKIDQVETDLTALDNYVGDLPSGLPAGVDTVVEYVDHKTGSGVGALNSEAGIASKSGAVVTIKGGIVETVGKIANSTATAPETEVSGYLNPADGKFYQEDTYVTEIIGEANKAYKDLATNKVYVWTSEAFALVREDIVLAAIATTGSADDLSYSNTIYGQTVTTVDEALDALTNNFEWNDV